MAVMFERPETWPPYKDIADEALHAMCYKVQQMIGQTDGGIAAEYFQADAEDAFYEIVNGYLDHEKSYATEDDSDIIEPGGYVVMRWYEVAPGCRQLRMASSRVFYDERVARDYCDTVHDGILMRMEGSDDFR